MHPKDRAQMMAYLTRPSRNRNRQFLTTQLVDDLEPGSLKDELLKDFDPSQETYEEYLQRKNLERPFNMADGGRIGFQKGSVAAKKTSKVKKKVDLRSRTGGAFANKTKEEIAEIMAKRKKPSDVIAKEKSIKEIFDKIFKEKNFSGIKPEFPGVGKAEGDINKFDPSRKGKTGGKIPNQWYSQHVSKAVRGDVDALNDLARITGRSVEDLQDAFSKRDLKAVRSEAAAKSSAKLDPVNKKLADLIRNNVVDKETIKKTLNISEDKFQKSIATLFKQSYDNRSQINKGKTITSYLGNTSEEITNLLQKLKQVDGVDQVTQRRNITQILDDLYGKEGTIPSPKAYNTMIKRVNEFYKLRALLPENIKLNLDHPIPEVLIQQLEKSGPTALRANVQPITQALNMGLKNKIDIAYANAYDLASKGNVNAKKIMGAIDEVAEKIDLPLGKVTNQYVGFGKNPFLSGDLKKVIVDNLKAQNLIVSKFESLDPKLKKRAGLDRLKNINIPQINIKEVEQAFGISNQGGFIDRQLLTDAAKGLGKVGTFAFDKVVRPLGTRAASIPLAGLTVAENIRKGENVADAVIDPLVGLELSFPGLFKENVAKITTNPTAQRILNLGRFARLTTPVGLGITAAGLGIDAAKFTRDRIRELQAMTPEQRAELRRQGARQAFDPFQAAGGGIAKEAGDPSGAMLESMNPDSQGLPSLLKRGRKG